MAPGITSLLILLMSLISSRHIKQESNGVLIFCTILHHVDLGRLYRRDMNPQLILEVL